MNEKKTDKPAAVDKKAQVEALLRETFRNVLEGGSDVANRYAATLAPAIAEAIKRGDKEVAVEIEDQIDGLKELGRIRAMQNTNRLIKGVVKVMLNVGALV